MSSSVIRVRRFRALYAMRTTESVMTLKTWVIGAGGLIGSAIARHRGVDSFAAVPIPWDTPDAADTLGAELERFVGWVGYAQWSIVWAAGAGVMHTSQDELEAERSVFEEFCLRLSHKAPPGQGGFYLISSAGGAYAGSAAPPFGVDTEPVPLNAYGTSKLAQEVIAETRLAGRVPVTIARVANAYGPGQKVTKRQGLVTELCLRSLLNQPATIFAPFTTLRDYVYVDDVAAAVVPDLLRMASPHSAPHQLRVIASGRSVSIAELLVLVERSTGRPIGVRHTFTGDSHLLDLRLVGLTGPLFDGIGSTPLVVGISLVFQDLLTRLGAGSLAHVV